MMAQDTMSSGKFNITLLENGVHSLWRGIESFEEYERTQEKMLLKDSLMFLHHGVELLLKQILIGHSPFLIFEDLKDAAKKQKQADDLGTGVFFLDKPPKTVSFEEAISRVDAFVKPPQLTEDLQANLNELNRLRNQLEHYALEVDRERLTKLLSELRNPLLELFEAQIGGIKRLQTTKVIQAWDKVQESARYYRQLEADVFDLIKQFKGQRIPGHLFNVEGEFTLPVFERVLPNAIVSLGESVKREVDILGEGKDFQWIVEVKAVRRLNSNVLDRLALLSRDLGATAWLVVFSEVPLTIRADARRYGTLVTGAAEWEELKRLIQLHTN